MKIVFFFSLLLPGLKSNSQNNFVPGYIITSNDDTLKGLVSWDKKPGSKTGLSYKQSENKEVQQFKWTAIKEASQEGTGNALRISTVTRDLTYVDKIDYEIRLKDSTVTETLPLELVYPGKQLSLYHYFENRDHFYLFDGDKMTELIQKYKYPDNWDKRTMTRNSPKFYVLPIYRDQLRAYYDFSHDKKMQQLLEVTVFEEKELVKLLKRMNEKM